MSHEAKLTAGGSADQAIFDTIERMRSWMDKAQASEADEKTTAFCCDQYRKLFQQFVMMQPQSIKGIRAMLEYLVAEIEDFTLDQDEIRPALESILASPALFV